MIVWVQGRRQTSITRCDRSLLWWCCHKGLSTTVYRRISLTLFIHPESRDRKHLSVVGKYLFEKSLYTVCTQTWVKWVLPKSIMAVPKDTVRPHGCWWTSCLWWGSKNCDLSVTGRSLYPAGHPAVWMLVTGAALITEISPFSLSGAAGMSEGCYCRLGGIFLLEADSRWERDGFHYWWDLWSEQHVCVCVCVHWYMCA